jgi:hypothetical protein
MPPEARSCGARTHEEREDEHHHQDRDRKKQESRVGMSPLQAGYPGSSKPWTELHVMLLVCTVATVEAGRRRFDRRVASDGRACMTARSAGFGIIRMG